MGINLKLTHIKFLKIKALSLKFPSLEIVFLQKLFLLYSKCFFYFPSSKFLKKFNHDPSFVQSQLTKL
jgi:hypothetical protein